MSRKHGRMQIVKYSRAGIAHYSVLEYVRQFGACKYNTERGVALCVLIPFTIDSLKMRILQIHVYNYRIEKYATSDRESSCNSNAYSHDSVP